jgi:alpha-beta hydrolase superfamily lysophospholipase
VNGAWFAIQFTTLSMAFYFCVAGYFVSEITIRPPWYRCRPNEEHLSMNGLPDYWDGIVHDPRKDLGLQFENVSFATADGYTLRGWYIPGSKAVPKRPVAVCLVHGGGRDRRAWLRHTKFLHEAGYTSLLFDFREHGTSSGSGKGFRYGMYERFDVIAATKYLKESRKFSLVCAMGTSVGASAVIMAAAIDPTIDMVIAENPILTCAHLQDRHIVELVGGYFNNNWYSTLMFGVFRRFCSIWLNIRVGNKPSKRCQSMHVIAKIAPRPLMLMHGTHDDVVPCYHSERLFELAREPKELWLVPNAAHCALFNKNREEFIRRVLDFLRRNSDPNADPFSPESSPIND